MMEQNKEYNVYCRGNWVFRGRLTKLGPLAYNSTKTIDLTRQTAKKDVTVTINIPDIVAFEEVRK